MVKKLTAVLLTMCMAVSLLPMFAQAASKPDIKVGDYVKMGTYNNSSILWRCVSIDDNGPLMLADRIVDTLAYDAKTNDNSNSKSHSRSYKRRRLRLKLLERQQYAFLAQFDCGCR